MTLTLEHNNLQRFGKRRRDRNPCYSAAYYYDVDHFRVHAGTVLTPLLISGFLHTGQIFHIREFRAPQPYETLTDDELKWWFNNPLQ